MTASYRAYIDESGDEGFTFLDGHKGSSRWLVLSALVTRKKNDPLILKLAADIRTAIGKPANSVLHFRDLKHEQRVPVARMVGQHGKLRLVSIMIDKVAIAEPETFQSSAHRLYRYAVRFLLERVSWLCRDNYIANEGDGTVDLVFSNRSAMSYDDLRSYLGILRASDEGKDVRIDWSAIDANNVAAINHDQLAGLQLADAVASGMFQAVNLNPYGEVESRYAALLMPGAYRHKGVRLDGYGVKFWPGSFSKLKGSNPQLAAFPWPE